MLLGLCVVVVALLGWGLAASGTGAGRCARGQQDHGRRFRELHHHPERVVHLDVQNLMLSDSHPVDVVGRVMSRAASRRLSARTMWRWAAVHGTSRLVMVVDAGVAEDTPLDHLDAGTAPDWTALNLFAGLADDTAPAGVPLADLVDVDAAPDYEDLALFYDLTDWSTVSLDPLELGRSTTCPRSPAPASRRSARSRTGTATTTGPRSPDHTADPAVWSPTARPLPEILRLVTKPQGHPADLEVGSSARAGGTP